MAFHLKEYVSLAGRNHFRDWLEELDVSIRARVQARLFRVELGNLGDAKSVGDGVHELRIVFGPGYRIYFAKEGSAIILLLIGGDKGSQGKDIRKAKELWAENRGRTHGKTDG